MRVTFGSVMRSFKELDSLKKSLIKVAAHPLNVSLKTPLILLSYSCGP